MRSRWFRLILILAVVGSVLPVLPVLAQTTPNPLEGCITQVQESGAVYATCMPSGVPWNGDLVVFAHGYVFADGKPPEIPLDQLVQAGLPDLVTKMGYAFAVTSYPKKGLAIKEGVTDILDLVSFFKASHENTHHVFLTGASEGGLVTTLALEQNPGVFTGGLASCGPIGDFQKQVNYWGDYRVVFDYFFPGLLPPSPVNIPIELMSSWDSVVAPTVAATLSNPANQAAVAQLESVTRAAFNPRSLATITETSIGILTYNVFATNEAIEELGGQPFDNAKRFYTGSLNDLKLNRGVERFSASQAALTEVKNNYQTTGKLSKPLITLHDIGDPIVPYWHEGLYDLKVAANRSGSYHINIPILRYGHCQFTTTEALFAFGLMVYKSTQQQLRPASIEAVIPAAADQVQYQALQAMYADGQPQVYLPVIGN